MDSSLERPAPRKAMIIERRRLMVPLLRDVLARAGLGEIVVRRHASPRSLRDARLDLVLLDVDDTRERPLVLIRSTRAATEARIIVLTRNADPIWQALAVAVGADHVLGAFADRHDLLTALAA